MTNDVEALTVDALGLLCPLPVLRLRKRMKGVASGDVVVLLADDPAAHVDVPHFCIEQGHAFLGADGTRFLIRKG
ncbi:sulfurtransferase TusA family protein [Jannaschia sp. LMIT008]|uniref:sulfurtransferase TusA family protein n=1 Tax=Jannaschia maritima TaxID=3032585 RepID=UPI0028127639|nr:sulfurtransferase TusA family protein [Jannaschia sp. LMIT008]